MFKYIADSTTGDREVGNDDITIFLRSLIFPTFLEKSKNLRRPMLDTQVSI